ncbi:histone H1oo-like [Thamnophis elegans]|uniref:histone H1oo-like n=1 Tax=Thamnophis elegans TaxID=35005 RepID=UPI001376796F|nr:histone H1oo-like [Thamnophis elegans]
MAGKRPPGERDAPSPSSPAAVRSPPPSSRLALAASGAARFSKGSYPPTLTMVTEAVGALNERKGSSTAAIKRYIRHNYPGVDPVRLKYYLRKALLKGLEKGYLVRPLHSSAQGATGRFKVSEGGGGSVGGRAGRPPAGSRETPPLVRPGAAESRPGAHKQRWGRACSLGCLMAPWTRGHKGLFCPSLTWLPALLGALLAAQKPKKEKAKRAQPAQGEGPPPKPEKKKKAAAAAEGKARAEKPKADAKGKEKAPSKKAKTESEPVLAAEPVKRKPKEKAAAEGKAPKKPRAPKTPQAKLAKGPSKAPPKTVTKGKARPKAGAEGEAEPPVGERVKAAKGSQAKSQSGPPKAGAPKAGKKAVAKGKKEAEGAAAPENA